ncbi:S-adenosyl-L-methionine-dependent methyltransferase [Chytridium lagenaria]|nr:S-adenosyl-L-methionine-dependent methyltransferase [Chytridium lagenaria]
MSPNTSWSLHAQTYANWDTRTTLPFAHTALDILSLPQFQPTRCIHVLDVAAGTGGFGIEVVRRLGVGRVRVMATDVAEGMVDVLVRRAGEMLGGESEAMSVAVMDGEALEIPDESVDVTACLFGVFLMNDGIECINEMHRVLRPGGLCVLTTWQDTYLQPLLLSALDRIDMTAADHFRSTTPPRRLPWDDGSWIADRMLTQVGFATAKATRVTHVMEVGVDERRGFAEYLGAAPGVGEVVVKRFVEEVVEVMGERFGDGVCEFSATANVVVGRRA